MPPYSVRPALHAIATSELAPACSAGGRATWHRGGEGFERRTQVNAAYPLCHLRYGKASLAYFGRPRVESGPTCTWQIVVPPIPGVVVGCH